MNLSHLGGTAKRGVAGHRRGGGGVSRGGQLEVAGVVVGSWGPNFGVSRGRGNVTHGDVAVGAMGRGRVAPNAGQQMPNLSARNASAPVAYATRGGRVARGRRGAFQPSAANRKSPPQNQSKGNRPSNETRDAP